MFTFFKKSRSLTSGNHQVLKLWGFHLHLFINFSNFKLLWLCKSLILRIRNVCVCVCMLSRFSCVQLFVTPWTVARQTPASMRFSRQESWRGLPLPPPGNLPDPGIEPTSPVSPTLAGGFFTTSAPWEACVCVCVVCVSLFWTSTLQNKNLLNF